MNILEPGVYYMSNTITDIISTIFLVEFMSLKG
jgi:hypothetical protein